jgi:hypothetical protein
VEEEGDHEVVRDVFGDSDEDEPALYRPLHEIDEDSHVRFNSFFYLFRCPFVLNKVYCLTSLL